MDKYVIDVNILFSGPISRKPFYAKIFSKFHFFTPDFALIELEKYKKVFLKKVKNEDREIFEQFGLEIFSQLSVIPDILIPENTKQKAFDLCKDTDEKDFLYLALALHLNIPLLTRDIPLYEALYQNSSVKIILFDKFLQDIESF